MKVEVFYLVNGTTKTASFTCDSAECQIFGDGRGNVRMRGGRDEEGKLVEAFTMRHCEVILRRP